jgi:hypothetical protein
LNAANTEQMIELHEKEVRCIEGGIGEWPWKVWIDRHGDHRRYQVANTDNSAEYERIFD